MTEFTGNTCLDVVNDGYNNQVHMADCGNSSGQAWTPSYDPEFGGYRMKNDFTGDDVCLEVAYDGSNYQTLLNECSDYSGQNWSINPR